MSAGFENLTPDCILDAVEMAMGCQLTGLTAPLPSYINRVYELQPVAGDRLIAKFYRPGRWKRTALQDEHDFVLDCAAEEIPVVAPLELANGGTIGEYDGILFSVFPKRSGREMDLHTDEGWRRLGSLVGRIHLAGSRREAGNRLQMHPATTTIPEIGQLLDGGFMSPYQSDRFKDITRGNLDKVIDGLMTAKRAGFSPIKINMVVLKGINDDEVEDMIEFCIEHDFTLRFIETMPMGDTGRNAVSHYLSLQDVRKRLDERYELIPGVMPGGGPAKYLQVAGSQLRIGFITPISQHFCETCNRVRLAADGTLYLCLGQDHKFEFRPLMREGISDAELLDAVQYAITLKPERHEFNDKPQQVVRFMAETGG